MRLLWTSCNAEYEVSKNKTVQIKISYTWCDENGCVHEEIAKVHSVAQKFPHE